MNLFTMVIKQENEALLKALDEKNINMVSKAKTSLLHIAIAYGNDNAAIELIKRGIDLSLKDDKGQTVLHYVGFYNNHKIGGLILQRYSGLSEKDNYGNTPLWYAVFNADGNYETVKLFIKYEADPHDKNNNDKSPIDFARQIKDNQLVDILLGI